MARHQSLAAGTTFGRLTVIEEAPRLLDAKGKPTVVMYKCQCSCEKQTVCSVRYSFLNTGKTQSCGCLKNEAASSRMTTHGLSDSRVYEIWQGIIKRCEKPSQRSYKDYGGRGIRVCDRWKESFLNFLEDMGYPPTEGHSIERLNVDGNYEPSNCAWATVVVQVSNRRNNVNLEYKGETKHIAEWARIAGLTENTLRKRVLVLKWDVARAIETPPRPLTK